MIRKNFTFSKTSGITLMEFGHGNIQFTEMKSPEDAEIPYAGIAFRNRLGRSVGEIEQIKPDFDDFSPSVVISFDTIEAIDIFRKYLDKAEQHLKEAQ